MKKIIKKYLPGKVFLVLIVTVLLGLLGYGVYTFIQKRKGEAKDDTSVNLVLVEEKVYQQLDTDNDGIPDWEEDLWDELDPLNPDSDGDGVSDYDYLRQKKRDYENDVNSASGITEKITESDRLGRGLYVALTALLEQGDISDDDREAVVKNVTNYIADLSLAERIFIADDFYIVDNGYENSMLYKKELAVLTEKYPLKLDEFRLILTASAEPDLYGIEVLNAKLKYQEYTEALQLIAVPMGISKQHIELTNIVAQIGGILDNLNQETENIDDIVLLSSLLQSQTLFHRTIDVLYEIGIYFNILNQSDTFADQERYLTS